MCYFFFRTSMVKDSQFKIIDLLLKQGMANHFEKIVLLPFYDKTRPTTKEKYKAMRDSLACISPIHHEKFKQLQYLNKEL